MSFVKYLSPCCENLLLVTYEEKLLLTIKAMVSFFYYFGQKDVLECVGVREKQVPAWAYMQLPIYLVFLLSFPMLSLDFKDIS